MRLFAPYKVGAHRHTPEIEETLSVMAEDKVSVTFTPHLLPINRGILLQFIAFQRIRLILKKFINYM